MAFTQTQLDTLDAAIASGALKVKFQDREITYNSTEEMLKARAIIYNQLHPSNIRQTRVATRKGW